MRYISDELSGPTVFKDVKKLDFDYVPDDLQHRDDQLRKLARIFGQILKSNVSENVLIKGSVGTGKTAISKKFCEDFEKYAEQYSKSIETVRVNCHQRNTDSSVLLKLVTHFQPSFPDRGFSVDEMLDAVRKHLKKRQCHLIIVLDEVDVLIKKSGSNLIYLLTRFNEEDSTDEFTVSLILISQLMVFDMLDPSSLSTFKRTNLIECNKYSAKELVDIINQRINLAFNKNTVDIEAIDLICDIASREGDARLAIELLWNAGLATDDKNDKKVTPEHVRIAKGSITTIDSKLNDLSLHEKIILMMVARELKKGGAYTTTGDIENLYHIACEEYNQKPRGHTQFWNYIKNLDAYGFISAKKSGEGIIGNTTVISLPDIPAKELEEILLKRFRRLGNR
jgi:cell division control protein 6